VDLFANRSSASARHAPRYRAFARYLLSLCEYAADPALADPDYHNHFDSVCNNDGKPTVHLIVHAPATEDE